jgi:hypothetical protein
MKITNVQFHWSQSISAEQNARAVFTGFASRDFRAIEQFLFFQIFKRV